MKKTTEADQTLELTIGLHGGHSMVKGRRKIGARILAPFVGEHIPRERERRYSDCLRADARSDVLQLISQNA